jgi:hypothetical protein
MIKFVVVIFIVLFASCRNDNAVKKTRQLELIPEPDIEQRLAFQKTEFDSIWMKKAVVVEYLQIDDKQKPIKVIEKDDAERDYITHYYICKDSNNVVKAILETPNSQSGDWFLQTTHYFDADGQVYAFQKNLNTFHHADSCGEETAIYINTVEFMNKGMIIKKLQTIKNAQGKEFKKNICTYADIEMPIYKSLSDWEKATEIEIKNKR